MEKLEAIEKLLKPIIFVEKPIEYCYCDGVANTMGRCTKCGKEKL
jgi:hypothetical protein